MSLLLSQVPAPFDPATGFPYEQPIDQTPRSAPRCVALAVVAVSYVFCPPPLVPGTDGFPYPSFPDQVYAKKRPVNEGGRFDVPQSPLRSIAFDASADRLSMGSVPPQSKYTISMWAKLRVDRNTFSVLWSMENAAGTAYQQAVTDADGTTLKIWDATNGAFLTGPNMTPGRWYHFVFGHDSSDALNDYMTYKPDGGSYTTVTGNQSSAFTSFALLIAQDTSGGAGFFGNFDAAGLKVWSTRLTSGQAQTEGTQLAPVQTSSIWAYFDWQSTATMLVDSSGGGRSLTNPGGAGAWQTDIGPWIPVGTFTPIDTIAPRFPPTSQPTLRPSSSALLSDGAVEPVTFASATFDPSTGFGYQQSVDFAARGLVRPVNEGGFAPFVNLFESALPPITWQPEYPDFVRSAQRTTNEGGLFRTHVEYEPTHWFPTYPDKIWTKPVPVNEGGAFFANFDFVPKLSWQPEYPDFARAKPVPVATGTAVHTIQEYEPTDWFPEYPNYIWAKPRPVNEGGYTQYNNFFSPNPAPLGSWYPEYPDFAKKLFDKPVNVGGESRTHLEYEPTIWLPSYPDFAYAAKRPVNTGGQAPYINFFSPNPAPPLSWLSDYPDFAKKLFDRPVNVGGISFVKVEYEPTHWFPTYPDRVYAKARPVNEGGSVFVNRDVAPKLSWLADFPDFARAAKRPVNAGGLVQVNTEYEPIVDWTPEYPDFAPGPERPVNEGGAFFVKLEREPITDWLGEYPDFVRSSPRNPLVEGGTEFLVNDNIASGMSWFYSQPDFVKVKLGLSVHHPWPLDEGWLAFVALTAPTPNLTQWAPTYPDFNRFALKAVNVGGSSQGTISVISPVTTVLPIPEPAPLLLKSLELPLPNTLTRIYGIHQSDIVIASALKVAIADIRKNPWQLDYVFASLPQDPLTWREYGEKSVQAAKEWFLKTEIAVMVTPSLNELKTPAITIGLMDSSEVIPEATLGDVDAFPIEDNDMTWPALCDPFTPKSYLPSTGQIVLKTAPEDFYIAPGMFIVDKQGTAHEILDVESSSVFSIAAQTVPDLRDCVFKSSRPAYKVSVESMSFRETYRIGCHVAGEPVYVTWLHSIMVYAMLRYKQALLEARGFERTSISSSDFSREPQFETENIFSRYITVTGYVRQYWPKNVSVKTDAVIPYEIKVSGQNEDVQMEGSGVDPNDSLWIGNLDSVDPKRRR